MQARSLEDCLKADGGLARLSGHAARLLRLQRVFESAVPRPLARGARVANLKLGKLIIHADSGAAATKLRQIIPTLVDVFHNEAAEVTGIEIKVQPRQHSGSSHPTASHAPLGDHAKQGLTSLADSLPENSPLRGALKHLVKHT
ncbi:MAG: hypothetical protein A2045_07215 [Rhodocyclales bacterium GWA2_65_20]|nr:MAG: hypothetical protein A2045_07215 [Rhodocyclales bacterium GWA2_65_20]